MNWYSMWSKPCVNPRGRPTIRGAEVESDGGIGAGATESGVQRPAKHSEEGDVIPAGRSTTRGLEVEDDGDIGVVATESDAEVVVGRGAGVPMQRVVRRARMHVLKSVVFISG